MSKTGLTYRRAGALLVPVLLLVLLDLAMVPAIAQSTAPPGAPTAAVAAPAPARHGGGEANLIVPDLGKASFLGFNGRLLL